MGYGGESPVTIGYKGLHSFKGVILLCQGVLEAGGVSHLHGSALLTIPIRGFRKILCAYLTNDPLTWIGVHVAHLMFLSLFRGPWSFSWFNSWPGRRYWFAWGGNILSGSYIEGLIFGRLCFPAVLPDFGGALGYHSMGFRQFPDII